MVLLITVILQIMLITIWLLTLRVFRLARPFKYAEASSATLAFITSTDNQVAGHFPTHAKFSSETRIFIISADLPGAGPSRWGGGAGGRGDLSFILSRFNLRAMV